MTIQCRQCGAIFENYGELASHINTTKSHHRDRKAVKWAANFQLKHILYKPEHKERIPLTEEQKESRRNLMVELSGETQNVIVVCPKCKTRRREAVPVEHTQSERAWRINKELAIFCQNCSQVKGRFYA
jgi:hypothetical protein